MTIYTPSEEALKFITKAKDKYGAMVAVSVTNVNI